MSNILTSDELNDKLYDMAVCNVQDEESGEMFYALNPADIIKLIQEQRLEAVEEYRERNEE